jgi:hypothetical protein
VKKEDLVIVWCHQIFFVRVVCVVLWFISWDDGRKHRAPGAAFAFGVFVTNTEIHGLSAVLLGKVEEFFFTAGKLGMGEFLAGGGGTGVGLASYCMPPVFGSSYSSGRRMVHICRTLAWK